MKLSKSGLMIFSDSEKHEIIQEVLSGRITKEQARNKYDIRGKSAILIWMRIFGYMADTGPLVTMSRSKNKQPKPVVELPDDPAVLKQRIEQLEKELKAAQLNALAQSTMIDIAEQAFKIPIRKKSATKQSPK
jgi:transposase-like protein